MNRRSLLTLLASLPLSLALRASPARADDEGDDEPEATDDCHPFLVAVRDSLASLLGDRERRQLDAINLAGTTSGNVRCMLRVAANTAAHGLAIDALNVAGLARMASILRRAPLVRDDDSARTVAELAETVADDIARARSEAPGGEGDDCDDDTQRDDRQGAAAGVAMAASQVAADAADPSGYEHADDWSGAADAVESAFARTFDAGVPRARAVRAALRMMRQMALVAR